MYYVYYFFNILFPILSKKNEEKSVNEEKKSAMKNKTSY